MDLDQLRDDCAKKQKKGLQLISLTIISDASGIVRLIAGLSSIYGYR